MAEKKQSQSSIEPVSMSRKLSNSPPPVPINTDGLSHRAIKILELERKIKACIIDDSKANFFVQARNVVQENIKQERIERIMKNQEDRPFTQG